MANGELLPNREDVTRRQHEYLSRRYDISFRTHPTVTMSGGRKQIPVGPTARLNDGQTWDSLAKLSPEDMRKQNAFPYPPLWHPLQEVGGMVFPHVQTKDVEGLERVDVSFDIPLTYLPEFPPPLYLTSRPDLGDVSRGQRITLDNYEELFGELLTPVQLDGLKLLLTKMPAQRHNQTLDRSTARPVQGVACFDCHVNGHTTAQFDLTPDVRPHSERYRLDTVSLRGVAVQARLGSKRNIRSIEQFAQSAESAAYFDGDASLAESKGARKLSAEEAAAMAQFLSVVDFPPAPKLLPTGALDRAKASDAEVRGERVFVKHCASCHAGLYFSDNVSHDLQVERFYAHVGSARAGAPGRAEGAFKTPVLRGIKDSPPYLHDGRLLTLEDTVEFFNLVLQLRLKKEEKADLVEYLRAL